METMVKEGAQLFVTVRKVHMIQLLVASHE
jgi:hypothetical protein